MAKSLGSGVKEKIRNAISDPSRLREQIKIGVEIETQYECEDQYFDDEAAEESARDGIDTYDVCSAAGISHDMDWIRALGCHGAPMELADKLGVDIDDMVENIVDSYRDDSDSCFWSSGDDDENASDIGDEIVRRTSWEHDEDGSVSGREFRFSNPVEGVAVAESMVETLFERIDDSPLTIDNDCSCHIHLQLPNMFHTGCNLLQQLIFEELFTRTNEFPVSAIKRLKSTPRWIQPNEDGNNTCKSKYNPIQCHSLGTWEFRLWGRISNADDFRVCLELSIGALERAYARYIENPHAVAREAGTWCRLAREAMYEIRPIKSLNDVTFVELPMNKPVVMAAPEWVTVINS